MFWKQILDLSVKKVGIFRVQRTAKFTSGGEGGQIMVSSFKGAYPIFFLDLANWAAEGYLSNDSEA